MTESQLAVEYVKKHPDKIGKMVVTEPVYNFLLSHCENMTVWEFTCVLFNKVWYQIHLAPEPSPF